jgi:cell volume regulation protein A
VSGLVTRAELEVIAPYFAPITLVIVLFDGGSALRLEQLSRAAPRSSLLALVGFLFSVIAIAIVSMLAAWVGLLPEQWSWFHGLMLGSILGGSSSIIIMPSMALARARAKLANLLGLESAFTDALCVVATTTLIDALLTGTYGALRPMGSIAASVAIGAGIGGVAGLLWILLGLRFLRGSEHGYPITLAGLLLLYVAVEAAGGSAALGILAFSVVVGNAPMISERIGLRDSVELDTSVRGFHKQVTFIIKSFFFLFIGAMLGPPWGGIVLGVLLALVLFAARMPAVRIALFRGGFSDEERRVVTVCLPRGMAAGVLATLPIAAGVPATEGLSVVAFACVLGTIVLFAVGFARTRSAISEPEPTPTPEGEPPVQAPAAATEAQAERDTASA